MEDFEKKYKEALGWMREVYPTLNGSTKDNAEQYFPELKENEDERIRKELIFFLKEEIPQCSIKEHADKLKEFVSYLEKQKEQKIARWKPLGECSDIPDGQYVVGWFRFADFRLGIMCNGLFVDPNGSRAEQPKEIFYIPNADEEFVYVEQKPAECINIEKLAEYIKAEFESFRNLLKKKGIDYQPAEVYWTDFVRLFVSSTKKLYQPAEWSEEDETMLERCISKMANIIPVPGKHGLTNLSFEKHTDEKLAAWLKSLPERFNLQPKQEWSEEDEQVISAMIRDFESEIAVWEYKEEVSGKSAQKQINTYKGFISFIKSLHPQPKQEWSEEDEKMRASIIFTLAGFIGNEDKIDWLKSLRPQPHWNLPIVRTKEIDEQMFNDIIARFDGRHFKYEMLQAMKNWLVELRERVFWKPSEEQMKELLNVEGFLRTHQCGDKARVIAELYEQLKKL